MKFFWDYPFNQAKQPVGFQKTSKHPPEVGGRRRSGTPNLRLERILVISMVARFPITIGYQISIVFIQSEGFYQGYTVEIIFHS